MDIHAITGKTRVFGVIGWPVEHSLSPPMHNAALRKLQLDCVYVAFPVEPARLSAALRGLVALGVQGINVTIPHKQEVIPFLDEVADEARRIRAVNTIEVRDGKLIGHNTDRDGFTRALEGAGCALAGKSVLIVGAGGVGRAMAFGAARAGAAKLVLLNRTLKKAQKLALEIIREFPGLVALGVAVDAADAAGLVRQADVVANATSIGMKPEDGTPLPPEWISVKSFVFDSIYNRPSPLLEAARGKGCKTLDGATMLAHQGAAALEIWTGRQPDSALMVDVLNQLLKKRG